MRCGRIQSKRMEEYSMLEVTITPDQSSRDAAEIPADLKRGLDRASEVLRADLNAIAKKFDLSIEWNLVRRSGRTYEVFLTLSAEDRIKLDPVPIPVESLTDTESIRRIL